MAEIQFKEITKRYPDGFEAVKAIDLDIADGEFMILVGPSGCGKSTALRMIAGLEDITDGDLHHRRASVVNDLPPRDRDIAMVFQNYALYPHMTVRDNMGFALKLAKADSGRDRPQGLRGRQDPRPRAAPRAQAGEPLRRPAPARRDGPRDRARPEGVPDGRAAVEPRREAARADAHRGRAHPAPARHHDGLRDARPDRGHDARRPRRRHARRPHPAGRLAGRALRGPDQPVRRRLHRLAVDELPAGPPRGRDAAPAVRADADPGQDALRASRAAAAAPEVIVGVRPEHFEDATIEGEGHGPDEVPRQGRRRRVDGLRAVRLLRRRHQGRGAVRRAGRPGQGRRPRGPAQRRRPARRRPPRRGQQGGAGRRDRAHARHHADQAVRPGRRAQPDAHRRGSNGGGARAAGAAGASA